MTVGGGVAPSVLETLEFPAALERVAAHAAGPLGAARLLGRSPATDPAAIRAALAQALTESGAGATGSFSAPRIDSVRGRADGERVRVDGSELAAVAEDRQPVSIATHHESRSREVCWEVEPIEVDAFGAAS